MLTRLTIHLTEARDIAGVHRTLRENDARVVGGARQQSHRSLDLCVSTSGANNMHMLAHTLLEQQLAETVLVEHLYP